MGRPLAAKGVRAPCASGLQASPRSCEAACASLPRALSLWQPSAPQNRAPRREAPVAEIPKTACWKNAPRICQSPRPWLRRMTENSRLSKLHSIARFTRRIVLEVACQRRWGSAHRCCQSGWRQTMKRCRRGPMQCWGDLAGSRRNAPEEGNPNEGQHPITPDTIHRIASASNEERARDGQSSQSERASGAARRIHLRPAAATA